LAAIQQVNRSHPRHEEIGVVMVSSFTKRGADVTMQALQAGAFDFVTKPSGGTEEENLALLRHELLSKVRGFLNRRRRTAASRQVGPSGVLPRSLPPAPRPADRVVRAVVIGASTGGPKALATLLPELARRVDAPILVVQHIPAEFTRSLAENLARQTGCNVMEAVDGASLRPRTLVIARGGQHLLLRRDAAGGLITGLTDQPPESGCRPSASVLFRSAAAMLGRDVVAIVLTGMGNDGVAGLGPLKRAGGYVIAQDEETSIVWGMPGSAVAAGLADEVLPLPHIAQAVAELGKGCGKGSDSAVGTRDSR
jgi:two-component system chemotaxis response regulator CheB